MRPDSITFVSRISLFCQTCFFPQFRKKLVFETGQPQGIAPTKAGRRGNPLWLPFCQSLS
ncbi:MAG: hypothetical protein DRR00_13500 [Candidatus Parabeggiatoa sp. nov. 3]|nr:MAG: hypothetical protein DRR00_13500 [Gammaproteobacteria bacterium]